MLPKSTTILKRLEKILRRSNSNLKILIYLYKNENVGSDKNTNLPRPPNQSDSAYKTLFRVNNLCLDNIKIIFNGPLLMHLFLFVFVCKINLEILETQCKMICKMSRKQ